MLLFASTFAWVRMEGNGKYAMREGICTEVSSEPFDYISKPSRVCCDGLSAFLHPEMRLVGDEHHKVLSIKCLLLNPIKWISFPFHNIIMSQKPSFPTLYIFFSLQVIIDCLACHSCIAWFSSEEKENVCLVSHCGLLQRYSKQEEISLESEWKNWLWLMDI